jgi:hypothetical protein
VVRSGGSGEPGERRVRDRPAVAVLRSEADFTDPDLSRERRWLALFLMVHMVDEHGRLGAAYRRVLRRAARVRGHWAQGRSLGAVRAEVTRWIGPQARSDVMPPWDRIADLIHDAVHPRSALDVLATARYLHCLATGEPNDALIHRPDWLDPEVGNITAAMIGGPEWTRKHGLPETVTVPATAPVPAPRQQPRQPQPPQLQPPQPQPVEQDHTEAQFQVLDHELDEDQDRNAYQLLWTVVRVHRDALARIAALEHQVRQLHEENTRLSEENTRLSEYVTSWPADYRPAIPDQDRHPRSPRPVTDRHLALEDPAQAFTYPLPADLPAPRPT